MQWANYKSYIDRMHLNYKENKYVIERNSGDKAEILHRN